jgi:hypothetical protein
MEKQKKKNRIIPAVTMVQHGDTDHSQTKLFF